MSNAVSITGIGQDSHRFCHDEACNGRRLILGGVEVPGAPPLAGNSDADVVLHALCNAISGLTGVCILGEVADAMCRDGMTDSRAYVRRAICELGDLELLHLSFSIEGMRPRLAPVIDEMRRSIAELTGLSVAHVAITATSGEGLTAWGRGEGLQCFCLATAKWSV